jgi:hypothetical protein
MRAMLREVKDLKPRPGEQPRRWFTDEYFDLFVWYEAGGGACRFELCYGKPSDEHALTWQEGSGVSHSRVDDGEGTPLSNMTPIVLPDGFFPAARVAQRFRDASLELEPGLTGLVLGKILSGLQEM